MKSTFEALLTLAFSIATLLLLLSFRYTNPLPDLAPVAPVPIRSIPVANYDFDLVLDTENHKILGKGVIRWMNRSAYPVSELVLHLYANAFQSERSRFLSDRRPGWHIGGSLRHPGGIEVESFVLRQHGPENLWPRARRSDPSESHDDTDMSLSLDRPIEPGEKVDIDIAWTTTLPSLVARMGYHGSFHMASQFFPKIAKLEDDGRFAGFPYDLLTEFYSDFGEYDIRMSVPHHFVVGATGKLVSEKREGDRKILRHIQSDIHDFAFAAWDGFQEFQRDVDGIDVRVLYPPGFESAAKNQGEIAAFGLRHYGKLYGAYPYPTLTIVHPPRGAERAGAMEYPTLITTGGTWWKKGALGSQRSLTLHELAHQHFYGMVATNENAWPFLDEGLTSFAEASALEAGWPNRGTFAFSKGGISAFTFLRSTGASGAQDGVIATAAPDFQSGFTYGRLVYSRTALVLETLDRVYGGRLQQALGIYARHHRFDHPGPEQLLDAVRDTLGEQAATFLRTCLFDRGWVDLAILDLSCWEGECTLQVARRGNLSLPVDILWLRADGSEVLTTWKGDEKLVSLRFSSDSTVVGAVVDPEHKILLDDDLSNNGIRRDAPPRAWRTQGVLAFVLSLLYFAGSP